MRKLAIDLLRLIIDPGYRTVQFPLEVAAMFNPQAAQILEERTGIDLGEPGLPQLDPLQVMLANTPLIIGAGAALIGIKFLADAYSKRTIIQENWTDKAAPSELERMGKDRKYLKDWFKRHSKELKALGSLALIAGLGLVSTQAVGFEPTEKEREPYGEWQFYTENGGEYVEKLQNAFIWR